MLALFLGLLSLVNMILRVAAAVTLPLRHSPAVAMAWLLPILLWPLPGGLVYMLFGSRLLPAERIHRYQAASQMLRHYAPEPNTFQAQALSEAQPTLDLATRLGDLPPLGGNKLELLPSSELFFERLLALIEGAKTELKLLYYIADASGPAVEIFEALKRAARRGVKVHFMADSVGSRTWFKKEAQSLRDEGVEVTELLPVKLLRLKAQRFDLRNHRKLAIADGTHAITGSHNLIDPTYGKKDLVWRDLSVELWGPVVAALQWVWLNDRFAEGGSLSAAKKLFVPEPVGRGTIQVLPSGPSFKEENFLLITLSALYSAKKEVTITSPYFVLDDSLLQAFSVLRGRGVRVRLLLPERCDQKLPGLAAKAYYNTLLDMGVELHLHTDGLLHAKTMTIDDHLAFVGSNNFDARSFSLNFELTLALTSPEEVALLKATQAEFLSQCRPLTTQEWRSRSRLYAPLEGLAKLLGPLL